jgi:hypothetical protein
MAEAIATEENLRACLRRELGENSWDGIRKAIEELVRQTGRGKIIDPFENPDGSLWNFTWNYLYFDARLYHEALTVAQSFLDTYYSLQEETPRERIHKGTPLQYLGIAYFSLNQLEQSRKFHIFAFIEDVLRTFESQEQNQSMVEPVQTIMTPATIVLKTRFRTTDIELKNLQDFVWETARTEVPFYPEEVYSKFVIESERRSDIVARSMEERLYKTNLHYLRLLKEKAYKDPTGKALELFAFYLFSCVDGFETVLRKKTSSFHFDVIVRNLIKEHILLQNLGEYIGIECKNIKTNVSVGELDHFIHKLRLHNMKCGIVFTRKGISGTGYGRNYGKLIVDKTFQRDGVIIFAITRSDMKKLCEGYNLLALMLRKYEDTRFK